MGRKKHKGAHAPDPDRPKPQPKIIENKALAGLAELKLPKVRTKKPKPPKKVRPPKAVMPVVRKASDAPLDSYEYDDRVAFQQAFAGVRPLGSGEGLRADKRKPADREALSRRVKATADAAEEAARARLDQLVGGGVHFEVHRHGDGGVEGRRRGAPARTARMLAAGELTPVARLDLHGRVTAQVAREVRAFVRDQHAAGRRNLSIVHGKGNRSEGGQGVLKDAVVRALTEGGAAPLVDAFASAPERFGGLGAILIRLRERAG